MRFYPGISVATLGVAEVERARRFYQRLGWRRSAAASNDSICFFSLNNIVLALFARDALAADSGLTGAAAAGFSGVALAQNYGSPAAVRQAMDDVLLAGGRELAAPQKTTWGGYHGVFADPDGHVWELAHNPFFELGADGTLTLPE